MMLEGAHCNTKVGGGHIKPVICIHLFCLICRYLCTDPRTFAAQGRGLI